MLREYEPHQALFSGTGRSRMHYALLIAAGPAYLASRRLVDRRIRIRSGEAVEAWLRRRPASDVDSTRICRGLSGSRSHVVL